MLQPSALQILPPVTLFHLEHDGNSTHAFSGKGKTPPPFPFLFWLAGFNSMHLALLSSPYSDCQAPSLKWDFFCYFGLLHTTSIHCLAAARLQTSAMSHSEELPPACCRFPELLESKAGGRGSLKKALRGITARCCVMGESQPLLSPWLRARGRGGCSWEFSSRGSMTLICFSFHQRWCAHHYRAASGSEGEISPPRDATLLPKR